MFISRHPVVENQFCQFATTSGTAGVGGVIAYAGSVCYLDEDASNQDAIVNIYGTSVDDLSDDEKIPFGFLMQKVKYGYHQVHPAGYMMPGDLGSSDVIAQPSYDSSGDVSGSKAVPVGVAHLGIWETVHYTVEDPSTTVMAPGLSLYVSDDGYSKVTTNDAFSLDVVVAKVMKGASAAQCQATINNTTLYPIRIKLLI
jgi:hypothetical protein